MTAPLCALSVCKTCGFVWLNAYRQAMPTYETCEMCPPKPKP